MRPCHECQRALRAGIGAAVRGKIQMLTVRRTGDKRCLPCAAMPRMSAGAAHRKGKSALAARHRERRLKRRQSAALNALPNGAAGHFKKRGLRKFIPLPERLNAAEASLQFPCVDRNFVCVRTLSVQSGARGYSCGASSPASSVCKSARSASLAFGPTAAPTQLGQPPSQGHSSSRSSAS